MWIYNYNNELYHHGVKGMKWGHRKASKEQKRLKKAQRHINYINALQRDNDIAHITTANAIKNGRKVVMGIDLDKRLKKSDAKTVKKIDKYINKLSKAGFKVTTQTADMSYSEYDGAYQYGSTKTKRYNITGDKKHVKESYDYSYIPI